MKSAFSFRAACLFLCLAALLAGCGLSESAAREQLEKDGMTDLKLEPQKEGGFSFTGKNKEGQACTGTISGSSSPGSSSFQTFKSCKAN